MTAERAAMTRELRLERMELAGYRFSPAPIDDGVCWSVLVVHLPTAASCHEMRPTRAQAVDACLDWAVIREGEAAERNERPTMPSLREHADTIPAPAFEAAE